MNTLRKKINYVFIAAFILLAGSSAQSQEYDKVEIKTYKAADSVYMLEGAGGNIGVSVGDDGVFLIDDQFAPLTEKIKAAVAKLSDKGIKFLINTHWHFDHVGGNEKLGEMGTIIVAHENVRKRLSTDQFIEFFQKTVPASPKPALPVITFTRDMKFHINDDEIEVLHLKNAHTDGDAIVYFRNSNVIHTGDLYFSGIYPFIDVGAGGSVTGIIEAALYVHSMINDKTVIIPGHGPLSKKKDLSKYINMLVDIRDRVSRHIKDGMTLEEIREAKPTAKYDKKWGKGFLSPDKFVYLLYTDLSR